ncbi:hypothetical protein ES703_77699 [subsurface metagenome]
MNISMQLGSSEHLAEHVGNELLGDAGSVVFDYHSEMFGFFVESLDDHNYLWEYTRLLSRIDCVGDAFVDDRGERANLARVTQHRSIFSEKLANAMLPELFEEFFCHSFQLGHPITYILLYYKCFWLIYLKSPPFVNISRFHLIFIDFPPSSLKGLRFRRFVFAR